MSRLRKKSTITVIIFISLCAIVVFNQWIKLGSAWDVEELTAPIGEHPTIDGKKDSYWSGANTTDNESPDLRLYAMINASFLYILVEVRVVNHDDDEFVKILMSNNTDSEVEDFVDAKLIQTRNFSNSDTRSYFSEDQHLVGEDYLNDSVSNFVGAANVSTAANSYSYYEFRLTTSTSAQYIFDYHNDTSLDFDDTYAITVQFGDHEEGEDPTIQATNTVLLSFEAIDPIIQPDPTIGPVMQILAYVAFSVVGVGFVVIVVVSYQSRNRI
ncbi:MAG: hypothetical protein ACTSRD_10050 [Promethearchaeota archaeon]